MKKLQSLEDFKNDGLHKVALSNVKGGLMQDQESPAGTKCVNEAQSSTGCVSYTSDTISDGGGVVYHNFKDISDPC